MSEATEDSEGPVLALSVIEALDRGGRPDWEALDRAYGAALLAQASACLRRRGQLAHISPEEAVNDFLASRVYPSAQARAMFTRPALGERPLRGRLLLSLARHCDTMGSAVARAKNRARPGLTAIVRERPSVNLPPYEELETLIGKQMAAIRDACPPRRRPRGWAFREALLVQLRLGWSPHFSGTQLRPTGGIRPIVLDLPLLERLTFWTEDEGGISFTETGTTLGQLWQQLRPALVATPEQLVAGRQVEALIPLHPGDWHTLLSRGRNKLQQRLGETYEEYFGVWGARGKRP